MRERERTSFSCIGALKEKLITINTLLKRKRKISKERGERGVWCCLAFLVPLFSLSLSRSISQETSDSRHLLLSLSSSVCVYTLYCWCCLFESLKNLYCTAERVHGRGRKKREGPVHCWSELFQGRKLLFQHFKSFINACLPLSLWFASHNVYSSPLSLSLSLVCIR